MTETEVSVEVESEYESVEKGEAYVTKYINAYDKNINIHDIIEVLGRLKKRYTIFSFLRERTQRSTPEFGKELYPILLGLHKQTQHPETTSSFEEQREQVESERKRRRPGWQRLKRRIDPEKTRERSRKLIYRRRPDLRNRTREERLKDYQRMLEEIAKNPPFESLEQLMREIRGGDWEAE